MQTTLEPTRLGSRYIALKMFALIVICLLLMLFSVKATPILFNLSDFNAVPATNRVLQLQFQSPFIGNNIFITSDTNGQIITNLPLATLINATIKAPPANITFQLWIPADTTGTNNATNFTAVSGITTYPAGATAPSIQMADARYARGTNSGGSGVGVAGGVNTTVTTNGSVVSVNATNQSFLTNGILTSANMTNSVLNLINDATNGLATKPFVTNAVAGLLNAGTNNLATQPFVTNTFAGLISVGTNGYLRTNVVLNLINDATNGLARNTITNGLFSGAQTTNYVMQNFYPTSNPSSFVTSSVTNGLFSGTQTTNAILGLGSVLTNGYIRSSDAAGLILTATNTVVNFTTNLIGITSNGLLSRIDATNNFIQISNGVGTNTTLVTSPAIGVTNLTLFGTENANQKSISNALALNVKGALVTLALNSAGDYSSIFVYSNAGLSTAWAFIPDNSAFGTGYGKAASIGSMVLAQPYTLQSWRFEGATGGFYSQFVNTSNLIGNVLNQITNIVSSVAGTGSFIASTNGTANNGAQGYFSIGGGYTFLTSTNVYGSTNAGSYQGNGTWVFNGVDLTNLNAPTHIVFSSPNYNMMSNAVTLYTATSIIGTWNTVSGSAPAPTFFLGMYADDSGVVWTGSGGGFTNLLNVSWNTNTTKTLPVRAASMYWVFTNGQPIYGIINTN